MNRARLSPAAERDAKDRRVLAALRLWVARNGVSDPRPSQLLALAEGPLLRQREVSAALQRLKARGEVLRTHLGWELPAPEVKP